jgi:mannose-1-phosphate guanylyltransferase/mannose-6-phosphate isomerase
MDKERFCVSIKYTLLEVMNVIETIRERGVVVLGDNGKVYGVITLGDIIQALVEGKTIYASVEKLIKPSFIYLNEINYHKAFEIFQQKNISFIPVVDKDNRLIDVITPRDVMRFAVFSDQNESAD